MTLEARDLSFAYPGAAPLFRGLSLRVEPGERVALCAPSGTGKTTLCRVLAGYLEPCAGTVVCDGAPVSGWAARRAQGPRPVQLLWQHPEQAFDPRLRMERSLVEAGDVQSPRVEELRCVFGIRPVWLQRLPHELSGGELMRFCMVRALMARPRYLIADEATAMLDAVTQQELWSALMTLQQREGFGLLLVSHSPALVDRVSTRRIDLA